MKVKLFKIKINTKLANNHFPIYHLSISELFLPKKKKKKCCATGGRFLVGSYYQLQSGVHSQKKKKKTSKWCLVVRLLVDVDQ